MCVKNEFPIRTLFPKVETVRLEYVCERHGKVLCETISVDGNEPKAFCPICEREAEEERQRKIELEEAECEKKRFEADKRTKNIEKEYWSKSFDDFNILSDSQGKALEAVKRLVRQKGGKVILLGANGCGKTMLGSIAVDMLGGKIYSMYEISCMIRQCYSSLAKRTELEIVDELATIPMLVIDEIGRTKGSEAELNWLSYILDKRHVRGLPFMLLTNTHLKRSCKNKGCDKCFENFVNNDVLSRLRQDSEVVTIDAPDYRARKK